jgi:hypothetical protein
LADQLLKHPGGTLPEKLTSPADLKALYRLMDADRVTHQSILEPHRRRTLSKACQLQAAGQVVLLVHDSTELDYTTKFSLDGLGQIGNGIQRGYVCHNSLALVADSRQVIGLANQILHHRPIKRSKRRTAAQKRADEQRESRLWLAAIEQIEQTQPSAGPTLGGAGLIVDVCDRGADTFEFLESQIGRGRTFVIRSTHDRRLQMNEGSPPQYLHELARQLTPLGERPLSLSGNLVRTARATTVQIAAAAVVLQAPKQKRGQHSSQPLPLWVVRVWEPNPPADENPIEWFLLTNHPAEDLAAACKIADWYGCRPVIEEFHKGQKTGCNIEHMQFTSEDRLQPAIALLSVVALTLLSLRDASRRPDAKTRKATELLHRDYVEVLSLWRYKRVDFDMSLHDFYYALARLGGHQNRRHDHPPGWIVLWRGWEQLQTMDAGADTVRCQKCG